MPELNFLSPGGTLVLARNPDGSIYLPSLLCINDQIVVHMRARTTSQIDWWHARLTSLASAVTLYVVRVQLSILLF